MYSSDDDFLEHFGVKGMKWGVRHDGPAGVSRSTNREARKDAAESASAKMFYGQGAGTRRKLINNSVAAKKARDPNYAKAFDHHLNKQDLSKHASGARKDRKRADRKEKTTKRAGYLARRFTGEMGTQAAFTAVALGGAAYLRSPKGQAVVNKTVRTFNNEKDKFIQQRGAAKIADWLKNQA